MNRKTAWWKDQSQFKDHKAVVKLYDEDGSFLSSINIPSVYWPLTGPYEAFHVENTCFIHDDPKLYAIFDAAKYKVGHCYSNSETLLSELHDAGYKTAQTYCGWAFIGESIPIHHCWIVISDDAGQKAILDLSCDAYKMSQWLYDQANAGIRFDNSRDGIVAWIAHSSKNLSNTSRCFPLGKLPPYHLYIGSPCDPNSGILQYHRLLRDFPGHLCEKTVNSQGYNPLQWKLKQQGLMP